MERYGLFLRSTSGPCNGLHTPRSKLWRLPQIPANPQGLRKPFQPKSGGKHRVLTLLFFIFTLLPALSLSQAPCAASDFAGSGATATDRSRPVGFKDWSKAEHSQVRVTAQVPSKLTTPTTFRPQATRIESWTEKWPLDSGSLETRAVAAEVWTEAFQAELDSKGHLHIPARMEPYYIDAPLVLKSGYKLTADPGAEIRLKPGTNTCMVRNERVATLNDRPVPADGALDSGIIIEGGTWTTLSTPLSSNGNVRGRSATQKAAFGTHGVILLQSVRGASVRNVTIRQSAPFGVHLANAHEFTVENITLFEHLRDGVHVNGPARNGVIRGVHGSSHDDTVALNAWEWKNYAPSYGPIENILIEDVSGAPKGVPSSNSIRILPGVKRFDDGTLLDCPVRHITLRHIHDISDFKLYDQPNLELGRQNDFSAGIGTLQNIVFEDLMFTRPGSIQVHANTDGLTVRGAKLLFPMPPGYRLLELGPKSMTYKSGGPASPEKWTEVFSPDLDCTVRNLSASSVRTRDSQSDLPIDEIVRVIEQSLNPDYPKTTPKGGTGKAIWSR